jgi:prephenate dehydrogenase
MGEPLAIVGLRNVGRWVQSFKMDKHGREVVVLTRDRAEAAKFNSTVSFRVALALDAFIERLD